MIDNTNYDDCKEYDNVDESYDNDDCDVCIQYLAVLFHAALFAFVILSVASEAAYALLFEMPSNCVFVEA